MGEKNSLLGQNIQTMRKFYNETQTDLANSIYVSTDLISKYERNKRTPNEDTLKLIAQHYEISAETLQNDILTLKNLKARNKKVEDTVLIELFNSIFIRTTSAKAKTNENFKIAHNHFNHFFQTLTPMENMLIESKKNYYKSFKEANLLSGAANTISVIFIQFSYKCYNKISLKKTPIININFFESIFGEMKNNSIKLKKDFLNENNEIINDCLFSLKQNPKTSDIADYYIALKYILNLVDNENSFDLNQEIGLNLMFEFADLKNKYAISYLTCNLLIN